MGVAYVEINADVVDALGFDPAERDCMRFHVLGIPHTISTKEYSACAFTQKVVRMCALLKRGGHTVIHYGHEDSRVEGEHVRVTTNADLEASYPCWDWRKRGFPPFQVNDFVYGRFYNHAVRAIGARKQPGDFLLCMFGSHHAPVAQSHPDLIAVEPGIGYGGGYFAAFKCFESYALLHAYHGLQRINSMANDMWYDAVIPNYFDVNDFSYVEKKGDYFVYLGRIGAGKGTHIAIQTVEAIPGARLIVAGAGEIGQHMARTKRPIEEYVEHLGVVGPLDRSSLLAHAKAAFCPSTYVEPFCGVQVEAMMSGTPVISTDWGAFTEYNLHGYTGYRCRTFEQFVWAATNIDKLSSAECRRWAINNFSMQRVGPMFDEYFQMVKDVHSGLGFYETRPERSQLRWLKKVWPHGDSDSL